LLYKANMRPLVCSLVFVAVVAACGGSVDSTGGGASSSGASGGNGASSGLLGGSCSPISVDGSRACVPGTAAAHEPIVVEIDDDRGCLPCFTTIDTCAVAVEGNVISLRMAATQCTPSGDLGCPAMCGRPSAKCTLPPLSPGKFLVEVVGEGGRTGLVPRELVVADDATETSCSLTVPARGAIDGTKYETSCSTDEDCRAATFGDLCQPCKCPNAAIATSVSNAYAADARAASSQCSGPKGGLACAACPPVVPRCEIQGSALAGTCKLEPG